MKILNLFFLLGFVVFLGCNKDNNPINENDNTINTIIPLKVGNSWTFVDSTFTENGDFANADTTQLKIIGKTNINYLGQNVEAYYWNWTDMSSGQPTEMSALCANDNYGLKFYGGRYLDSNIVLGNLLFLKFPTTVGESWNNPELSFRSDSLFYIADTNIVSCIFVDEKLKVAQETISCYVYKYYNERGDNYLYFAKNIGYIGCIIKANGVVRYKKLLLYRQLLKYPFKENRITSLNKIGYSIFGIK